MKILKASQPNVIECLCLFVQALHLVCENLRPSSGPDMPSAFRHFRFRALCLNYAQSEKVFCLASLHSEKWKQRFGAMKSLKISAAYSYGGVFLVLCFGLSHIEPESPKSFTKFVNNFRCHLSECDSFRKHSLTGVAAYSLGV